VVAVVDSLVGPVAQVVAVVLVDMPLLEVPVPRSMQVMSD
jgi:hypothetical protein